MERILSGLLRIHRSQRRVSNVQEVGGPAALGAVFGVLYDAVVQVKEKSKMFRRYLEDVKSTLEVLKPLIEGMAEYKRIILPLPEEQVEKFKKKMEKGVQLVHNCKVRLWPWESHKKYDYISKLAQLIQSLQTLHSMLTVHIQIQVKNLSEKISKMEMEIKRSIEECGVQGTRDVKETLDLAGPIEAFPSPTIGFDVTNVQGLRDVKKPLDSAWNKEVEVEQIEGGGVAEYEIPSRTVGLDAHLRELKMILLKDEVSVLVLTGPGGCGKTALAKMFCQDENVKDKFDKIFFVSVSENPNLDFVIQQLYQHNSSQLVPALQDQAIALNWLQRFLKETGQLPSLLVLDDVWPGSESLFDKFDEFKKANYKILVTSRFEFPRYGSSYYLKSLNDEDAMTLSYPSTSLRERSSSVPQKVVLKVFSTDEETQKKVFKAAASASGVESMSWDQKDQKLMIVGVMDTTALLKRLKRVYKVDLISVGLVNEKEEYRKGEKEQKKEE